MSFNYVEAITNLSKIHGITFEEAEELIQTEVYKNISKEIIASFDCAMTEIHELEEKEVPIPDLKFKCEPKKENKKTWKKNKFWE